MKYIKSPVANLYRSGSGTYFMRCKLHGRQARLSLKTKSFEIAKLKLRELHKSESSRIAKMIESGGKSSTVGELMSEYLRRDAASREITASTKLLHTFIVAMIRRTWPKLAMMQAREVTAGAMKDWAARLRAEYSASRYNTGVNSMRAILKIAVENGLRTDNPAMEIKKAPMKQKNVQLPTVAQFAAILAHMEKYSWKASTMLIRFLAFTGMRISEAAAVLPADIDLQGGTINLRGEITKSGKPRTIPIIPELQPFLIQWLKDYAEAHRTGPLMMVKDIRRGLEKVCQAVGCHKITNHDLRHLFTTRCIESGVDIKTVATWAGHQDGGALILRTYAHLRNEHSMNMAKLVRFTAPDEGEKIVDLKKSAEPPA